MVYSMNFFQSISCTQAFYYILKYEIQSFCSWYMPRFTSKRRKYKTVHFPIMRQNSVFRKIVVHPLDPLPTKIRNSKFLRLVDSKTSSNDTQAEFAGNDVTFLFKNIFMPTCVPLSTKIPNLKFYLRQIPRYFRSNIGH